MSFVARVEFCDKVQESVTVPSFREAQRWMRARLASHLSAPCDHCIEVTRMLIDSLSDATGPRWEDNDAYDYIIEQQ